LKLHLLSLLLILLLLLFPSSPLPNLFYLLVSFFGLHLSTFFKKKIQANNTQYHIKRIAKYSFSLEDANMPIFAYFLKKMRNFCSRRLVTEYIYLYESNKCCIFAVELQKNMSAFSPFHKKGSNISYYGYICS
jgi:hypothetical protein